MNYKEAAEYLNSHDIHKIDLGLDDIRQLLKNVGNPHEKFRSIHIAGTNGKGSVCAMLSSILQKAGYKVGLYTSPHLVCVNERIKINDKDISNISFASYMTRIRNAAEIKGITYFEIITAAAFLYFADKKVDYAVIETGLGGRLDATNVITPSAAAITTISLEHTQFLGNTITKIAGEKAGIIKKGIPVVTAADGESLEVIRKTAESNGAQLMIANPLEYETNLLGEFQKINAGIAAEISHILQIKEEHIIEGFKNVKLTGRLQFLRHNLLIDVAHNPHGTAALASELMKANQTSYYNAQIPQYRKLILVFGILNTKDYKNTLKPLVPLAAKIILTKPASDNAQSPELLAEYIKREYPKDHIVIENVREAVIYAQHLARKNDLILVTGSFYVVGEVMRLFSKN